MPEINATKVIKITAKTLSLYMKVRDEFSATLKDQDGEELFEYEGYVPSFMPGEHYGDYLILDIDLDTGQITNWENPTASDIEEWMKRDVE